jgi:hypothetical protein
LRECQSHAAGPRWRVTIRPEEDFGVTGRIVQISVSSGGVPKTAVPSARITPDGVEG